ncbi:hypothetical protein [Bacillus sp. NPDC077027]|uniref:hypothetical protein n=1 Tax=Bacillus sp. NPDC077027 TaxID=3390548 RepID=UPI003D05EEF7
MDQAQIIRMAKEITALDVKREEMMEHFMKAAGKEAYVLLRAVQNEVLKRCVHDGAGIKKRVFVLFQQITPQV